MIAAAFLARIAEPLLKLVCVFSQIVQRTSEPTLFACSEGISKMRCSFGHPLKMRAKRFRKRRCRRHWHCELMPYIAPQKKEWILLYPLVYR